MDEIARLYRLQYRLFCAGVDDDADVVRAVRAHVPAHPSTPTPMLPVALAAVIRDKERQCGVDVSPQMRAAAQPSVAAWIHAVPRTPAALREFDIAREAVPCLSATFGTRYSSYTTTTGAGHAHVKHVGADDDADTMLATGWGKLLSHYYALPNVGLAMPQRQRPGTLPDPRVPPSREQPFSQTLDEFLGRRAKSSDLGRPPAAPRLDRERFQSALDELRRETRHPESVSTVMNEMFDRAQTNVDVYNDTMELMWTFLREEFHPSESDVVRLRNCYAGMQRALSRVGSVQQFVNGERGVTAVQTLLALGEESERVVADIMRNFIDTDPRMKGREPMWRINGSIDLVLDIMLDDFAAQNSQGVVRQQLFERFFGGNLSLDELTLLNEKTFDAMAQAYEQAIAIATQQLKDTHHMLSDEATWFLELMSECMRRLRTFDPGPEPPVDEAGLASDIGARTRGASDGDGARRERRVGAQSAFIPKYDENSVWVKKAVFATVFFTSITSTLAGVAQSFLKWAFTPKQTFVPPARSHQSMKDLARSVQDLRDDVLRAAKDAPSVIRNGNLNLPVYLQHLQTKLDGLVARLNVSQRQVADQFQLLTDQMRDVQRRWPRDAGELANADVEMEAKWRELRQLKEALEAPGTDTNELTRVISETMTQKARIFSTLLGMRQDSVKLLQDARGDVSSGLLLAPAGEPPEATPMQAQDPVATAYERIVRENLMAEGIESTADQIRDTLTAVMRDECTSAECVEGVGAQEMIDKISTEAATFYRDARDYGAIYATAMRGRIQDLGAAAERAAKTLEIQRNTTIADEQESLRLLEGTANAFDATVLDGQATAQQVEALRNTQTLLTNLTYGVEHHKLPSFSREALDQFVTDGGKLQDCQTHVHYGLASAISQSMPTSLHAIHQWMIRRGTFSGNFLFHAFGGTLATGAFGAVNLAARTATMLLEGRFDETFAILFEFGGYTVQIWLGLMSMLGMMRLWSFGVGALSERGRQFLAARDNLVERLIARGGLSGRVGSVMRRLIGGLRGASIRLDTAHSAMDAFAVRNLRTLNGWIMPQVIVAATFYRLGFDLVTWLGSQLSGVGSIAVELIRVWPLHSLAVAAASTLLFAIPWTREHIMLPLIDLATLPRVLLTRTIPWIITIAVVLPQRLMGYFFFGTSMFNEDAIRRLREEVRTGRDTRWQALLVDTFGSAANVVWLTALQQWAVPLLFDASKLLPWHADDVRQAQATGPHQWVFPADHQARTERLFEDGRAFVDRNALARCDRLFADVASGGNYMEGVRFISPDEPEFVAAQHYAELRGDWQIELNKLQAAPVDPARSENVRRFVEELYALVKGPADLRLTAAGRSDAPQMVPPLPD
jgi:hypothetical protein